MFALENFGLIRHDEEDAFVKMAMRFDPANYVPRIEITSEPVP